MHTLMEIDPQFPSISEGAPAALLEVKRELEAEAPKGAAPDPFASGSKTTATGRDSGPAAGRRGRRVATASRVMTSVC